MVAAFCVTSPPKFDKQFARYREQYPNAEMLFNSGNNQVEFDPCDDSVDDDTESGGPYIIIGNELIERVRAIADHIYVAILAGHGEFVPDRVHRAIVRKYEDDYDGVIVHGRDRGTGWQTIGCYGIVAVVDVDEITDLKTGFSVGTYPRHMNLIEIEEHLETYLLRGKKACRSV
jgi:hypothetical protein